VKEHDLHYATAHENQNRIAQWQKVDRVIEYIKESDNRFVSEELA